MLARNRVDLPDWFWHLAPVAVITIYGLIDLVLSGTRTAATSVLLVVFTLLLLARRRHPVAMLAVMLAVAFTVFIVLDETGDHVGAYPFAFLVAFYEIGRAQRQRATLVAAVIGGAALTAIVAIDSEVPADATFIPVVIVAAPFSVGRLVRHRDRQNAALRSVTAALEHERELRAEQAVAMERTRIARELHDVISHSISVIAIQSQAVRRRLLPEQTEQADDLRLIESATRDAMAELQRLFGMLRATDETPQLVPQPGLAQLPSLIERIRASGTTVDLATDGTAPELAPGLDLTAYRIVQEALTNAQRHGDGWAALRIAYSPRDLTIEVENAIGALPRAGSGHGLLGMRERAALYGGEVAHGPTNRNRYALVARLPLAGSVGG